MTTETRILTPEDFTDITLWHKLPPVNPAVDSRAWEKIRIPVCAFDIRKWAGMKRSDIIVSCSGPAEYWSDEPMFRGYGYCDYHWTLHQHKAIFSADIITNPHYTASDRARDQSIVETYWAEQLKQGKPCYI